MNRCEIGDCREIMRGWIADGVRVQTCVTSPPYWGLRDYGVPGQLGLERTPEEYVAAMVSVFREVRRVLRDDGTCWMNLGDCYAHGQPGGGSVFDNGRTDGRQSYDGDRVRGREKITTLAPGLKPKDLVGIPWRVAFALQADGWYLRQDIIWAKPNPMPESVTDRCTKAHEYLFLLAKSERYYYDAKAIREDAIYGRRTNPNEGPRDGRLAASSGRWAAVGDRKESPSHGSDQTGAIYDSESGRNRRSVWTIATQPYAEAHFATFPRALIEPCIMAGSRVGDVVLDPFMGSGTTGQVAQDLGRKWLGCELNPEYGKLQYRRTAQEAMQL